MKRLKESFVKINDIVSKILDDIFLFIGITLLSIGVFSIYIPAGFITLGIYFIVIAYLVAKRGG